MSEAAPEGGTPGGDTPPADEFKAITSQEDLNKVLEDRLKRERAKFADYKDVKAKAAEFDKAQAANQSEAEKTSARITELEKALTATRTESTRLRIATAHGITDADDIELFLTGTDEETLNRQAKRLEAREADRKKTGNHVPREGNNPTPGGDDERGFVKELFDRAASQ